MQGGKGVTKMPDKLTDSEIVKALECSVKGKCPECPYFHSYPCGECRKMNNDVLDLINRQDAEIERLKNNISAMAITLSNSAKATRHESYKECIEEAKNKILPMLTTATLEEEETICFCLNKLDNLLKELVGDGDETK